jgi:hypothetical protein
LLGRFESFFLDQAGILLLGAMVDYCALWAIGRAMIYIIGFADPAKVSLMVLFAAYGFAHLLLFFKKV